MVRNFFPTYTFKNVALCASEREISKCILYLPMYYCTYILIKNETRFFQLS